MSEWDPNVQKMRRMVVAGATEAPLDAQGRVLIPAHLRDYAGLDKDVSVLDTGMCFEIWDHARFQQELQIDPAPESVRRPSGWRSEKPVMMGVTGGP